MFDDVGDRVRLAVEENCHTNAWSRPPVILNTLQEVIKNWPSSFLACWEPRRLRHSLLSGDFELAPYSAHAIQLYWSKFQ